MTVDVFRLTQLGGRGILGKNVNRRRAKAASVSVGASGSQKTIPQSGGGKPRSWTREATIGCWHVGSGVSR